MKIKNKIQKKVILRILLVIFGISAETFSQYYYFDSGGKTYQQGCAETVDIRINSNGEDVKAGRFHLILDPATTVYELSDDVSTLRSSLVVGSNQTFINWSADIVPYWKSGTNKTILLMDRTNATTYYNGTNGLYATIKFKPVFNVNNYEIQFGMEYNGLVIGSEATIETTLSRGKELINPAQQELYRTGTIAVLKEPCVADTNKPTISNLSITDGSSKKSSGDGLSFSLNDNGGVNGTTNVPYVFNAGAEWTGNIGGTISNQYGIDPNTLELQLSGNGHNITITNTTPGVSISWDGKTWQNNGLNANVTVAPEALFDFGIEKKITATFTFKDRAGNTSGLIINFNNPKGPTLISNSTSPAGGDVYVNLTDPIKLGIKDDWAGVNSGTIKITVGGIDGTVYGPYVFSGSDLNLSEVQGEANQPDYYVNITNHEMFPTSGTINVSVYAKDMEGTVDTISDYTFTTRPNCSEFQCCDPVLLDLGDGDPTYYYNTGLVISGGVNPTFSGDEQNITGVIDCNTEDEGLSVYDKNVFMFFTDDDEIVINGTGMMGVLSGNVLTLSYIVDHVETIIDYPADESILTTGNVNFQWHLTGMDDYERLSGYYYEIYSGNIPITGGFIDDTGIVVSLQDGEYEFFVQPVDLGGHGGRGTGLLFSIDTSVPSVVITGTDIGMCSPAGTMYIVTGTFSEAVTGIDASTLTVTGGTVQSFNMIPDTEAVWTVSAGSDGTGITLVSILTGAFEDLAGNTNTTGTDELSWDYDGEGPEFTLEDVEIPECTDGTMTISGVTQVGCASGHSSPYSWDAGATWGLTGTNTAYSGGIGEKIMTVRVRDAFGNYTEKTGKYTWTNVNPSVDDISVENVGLGTGINWRELSNAHEGECGTGTIEFSGFIDDGSHGTCTEEGGIITYVANTDTEYEGEDSCVFEITDDEGYTATGLITFTGIDTKKPTCEISYNENVCTSGDIALTMNATGAAEYSWNGFTSMSSDNLPHNVNGNGVYTGYVRDNVGNTGICTGEVVTFDNDGPIIAIPLAADLTAEECTLIQGVLTVTDDGGCGNGFNYSWVGFGSRNNANYSGYSDVVTGHSVVVSVGDSAGNISNQTLNYTWTDTGVQLNSDEKIISDIVLTGGNAYDTTTGDLISLFGAREGNCGAKYISVSKISCNGLSMDIDAEGNIVVTGNNNLTQTGSCELRFSDDDGNSENGTLKIRVDTVVPGVEIQGTNLACMSGSSFSVTGIFTESVHGFVVGNISVENGTSSSLAGNGSEYTWTVNMNPNVEVKVKVPAGAAFDLNGNPNTESNELTGMYDTAGPNKVILSERTKVYSETSKFTWQSVSDSGCAGVSGYIRELYEGSCEGTPKDSGITGAENFTVSGLENSGSYCRRVRSVDNFGNMGEWSDGDGFVVDLSDIGCDFDYVQTCTNGTLQVTLVPGDEGYTDNGTVYLSWRETGHWQNVSGLITGVTYSGQTLVGYIWQPATEKFNSCTFVATNIIDKANPEITSVTVESVPECTTGTAIATAISDEGCGQGTYTYNWNSEGYMESNSFQRYLNESGTQIISLKVRDNALNESTSTGVVFVWTDSPISGNNFTGYTGVGRTARTVNWREMSEVSDGDCGSGTITFSGFINSGTKGRCTRSGDEIMYTPNPNENGDDSCTIQVKDDEGGTRDIVISWEGIDTKGPSCTVSTEPLLSVCVSGSVAITLHADEEINSAVGGDINRGISGTNATGNVFANWSGNVVMSDLVGNTGVCKVAVNNINTGVLDAPVWLSPANGSNTNDNTLTLSWSGVSVKGCRYPSGYEVQIIPSGGDAITGFTTINTWTTPDLADGEYIIKVKTIDNLGGESEWTGITITIDTEKPTCEIQYDNACISGNVQLTMITTGADFYSWTNFSDMSESLVPNDVSSNGTYDCFVKDLAGNTGTNSTLITNIKTGVLSDPSNLTIVGGTPTNDDTPEFTWNQPYNDGCREVSGYIVQVLSGGDPIDIIPVDGTGWTPSSPLPDGEYTIIIKTEDSLSGESEGTEITFVIDRTPPNCSIEVMTENCTNTGVEIKLSGDVSDILTYSRWNGTTGNFGNNITTGVYQNGEYTGYVYDEAGNQGVCVGVVGTGIQDQILISYTTIDAEGFECEVITGSIVGNTGDSCGKDDLNKFTYSRPGGISTSQYGTSSNNEFTTDINVTISDGAGNSTGTTVKYTWNDTGVTLISGENQNVGVITGNYVITMGDLIDLFGATEGSCGDEKVTVTESSCSGASMTIVGGNITITPNENLDGDMGYCEFNFSDDEGQKTTTGRIEFMVDTILPSITLTGTNLACMSTNTFDVTGIFTEFMIGFESGDVSVTGGSIQNFVGVGAEYSWQITMDPMVNVVVSIPAGVATDLNGNFNTASNELVGMYDNVGPNNVTFVNWQSTGFSRSSTLRWNSTSDSGCAVVSGYNYIFVTGTSCTNNIISQGFTGSTMLFVDGLSHEETYTLCVQPVDSLGNTGSWTIGTFVVDLNSIGCVINESACSNTGVILILQPGEGVEGEVSLSWTGYDDMIIGNFLTKEETQQGIIVEGYIQQNSGGTLMQSSCTYFIQNIDKEDPEIKSFVDVSVPECMTGTFNISVSDTGCGNTGLYYSWEGGEFVLSNNVYSLWSGKAGSRIVDVQVKDNVGNTVSGSATIEWTDSPISGKNITVENVGRGSGVNWRELSEVSDGACGSGTVEFSGFVNTGSYGTCTTGEGDTIVYEPNEGYTGSDSCTIEVRDDDEQTIEIEIIWEGVDTEKPSCTLTVQEGQNSCISGTVNLILNSNSSDLSGYSFDRETFGNISTTGVSLIGIYTGYVIDVAGNISDPCTVEITGGVLDLDEPTLEVSDWIGYECDTGTITITGNDNSCGISGLYYGWEGFENTTNTNEIYSGIIGSQTVNVSVFDGVGHVTGKQVTYTWQNAPVTGSGFTVGNAGTGITVDWYLNGHVSAGSCELDDILAESSNTGMCEISGHNVIYKPTEGIQGGESCTITITDGDEEGSGDIEIEIIFTGVDTKKPTVELQGGIGEQCTNENTFTVTGTFDEVVQGVTIDTLTGENVEIKGFNDIDGKVYEWIVEMQGGTGKVWINSGEVSDLIGNEMDAVAEFVLGNYDNLAPIIGKLKSPGSGQTLLSTSFTFEWYESVDQGCADEITYILQICEDEECENADSYSVSGTGRTVGSLENGTGYWRVISEDAYGNTGVTDIQNFVVDARQPTCSIEPLQMCTTGNIGLVLTVDRDVTIENNGGVDWIGTGKNYTGEISENGEIVVVVRDVAVVEYTGRCEINVTGHDSRGPEITQVTGATYECEGVTIQINAVDSGCAGISGYNFGLEFGNGEWQVGNTLEISSGVVGRTGGIKEQTVTVEDKLGHESTAIGYILEIKDRLPMLDSGDYELGIITGNVGGIDIISEMGASEGACGIEDLTVELGECTNANWEINNGILEVEPNKGIEENGVCEVYIDDNEGSRVTGYVRYQVDTQAPNCEIIYDITGITNQDVTATLSCSGTSGEDWFATTGEVILTGDGEVIFEFEDKNGNTGSITGMVDWIDKTAPVCTGVTYSVTGGTSGDVTVTFNMESCAESVTLLTGDEYTGEVYTFTGNGDITFIYEDEAGNTGELVVVVGPGEIVWIDKEAPSCEVIVPDIWTNTGVTLTMDVVGDATGYSWNDVDWLQINSGLFVENTGIYTGYVRDEVRNLGVCTGLVEKIDKQRPTITLEGTNISGCTSGNTFAVTGIFDDYVVEFTENNILIINGIISDFVEVISGIQYTWTVTMTAGELTLYVAENEVTDRAGNGNIESIVLTSNYDNTGPESVDLNERNTVYSESVTLSWNSVNDSGCAGISGYVRELYEGACGQGTPKDSGTTSSGTENFTVSGLENSGSYCRRVSPVDNFGNVGTWSEDNFDVDLTNIGCKITPVEGTVCTSGEIMVKLEADGDYTENGDVYFSWISTGDNTNTNTLTTGLTFSGQVVTGYISQPLTNKSNYCVYTATNIIDQTVPTVESIGHTTGYECEIITGSIEMTDEGCGSGLISYIWDGLEGTNNIEYGIISYSGNVGRTVYVTGYDEVGNSVSTGVYFRWLNSSISWNNFTGNSYVGNISRSVNWREMSAVSDGACGSGTIEIGMSSNLGSKGECVIQGDIVTYTPYEGQTGSDICIIDIQDDEGDTGAIEIYWERIDTEKPSCDLAVQEGQSCTSGEVILSLSSVSTDVVEYSFDGITWTTNTTTGVNEIGTYTGYVKDGAGNTGMCNLEVTGGVLDLDEPELEVINWIGYECSTGIITVTGIDNSCGIVGLNYSWMGFDNITNTNEIYSGNVGSQTVEVTVYDGVGHSTGRQVTYTWQNIPVTGNSFIVENVGTGITVDWFTGANVSGGICELDDITATIEGSGSCEISGYDIIYAPTEGVVGEESCIVVITDGDEGEGGGTGIEIEITFTGVDTEKPTVQLQGGVGEQCTNENTFTVTGTFDEVVQGVTIDRLTGENINIVDFTGNGDEYEWTVNMLGGTGRVWILTGGIRDMIGNEMNTGDGITLGNYDNSNPQGVSLLSPESGTGFNRRTIDFEWTASSDVGCAGLSGYRLQICSDNLCNDVAETFVVDTTGISVTLQENGNYFWTVVAFDQYGNQSTGQTRLFNVESNEPKCSIVQSECSSSPVSLTLTGNKEISIVSGNISWQQVSQAIYSSEITENIDVWAIVEDSDGQTGYCHLDVNNYDNVGPDFDFGDIEVNEGEPLTINIVANDTGCAGISGYIFGPEFGSGERQSSGVLEISAEQIGNVGGTGKEQVLTVIDNLGNITTKTGNIVIKDVKPTISETGTIDGVQTGKVIIDVIDLLGAEEGNLGTGDLEVEIAECINTTGYISGQNLIVNMTKGVEGVGYCTVKIKDNEGSYSDVDGTIEFEVDTKEPVCMGFVFDPAGWTSGDSVSVSLDGCSEPIYSGDTTFVFTGNGDHTFVIEDDMGNTGEIVVHFTGFDRETPVFDFGNNSGYECQTGVIAVSNAVDTGIGLANLPYSFDGVNRSAFNTKEIYSGGAGNIYISGYVRDGLGNYKVSQANYVFNDSKPTATGFSVYALSGVKVNWKELSNATDGACGSGKLTASISGGSVGTCSVSGDFLIYEPDLNSVNSTNNYDLMIYDDEGSSVIVNVEFKGVTSYPDVELVTPIDGLVLDPGKVRFAWKGQGNHELIDKYVYNIWSSNDTYSIEQTGLNVSIDLKPGAYHWNVYAKYIDSTTGGLSDTYSFNVAQETSGLSRDRCPYGDFSNSYYDGTCEKSGSHGSADMCGVSSSSYSDEQKIAYLYAYSYGITTMCPIETAYLDGYLIRSHFAKMISEFAVNVLGKTPNKGKAGCDRFDDIENETDEMKYFMKTACELELMGQESDGVTPAKSFNPNDYVTRAQFGTVLSRLLFGDVYNIKDESKVYMNEGFWYKDHLQALKDYGIMTKIDGDWPNSFERRGRVMLMLQRADEYGVFAGKIPAKNGVRALFDE